MKNIHKIAFVGLSIITASLFTACEYEADEDVAPIEDNSYLPEVSITSETEEGTIAEGTTVTYTITLDKPYGYPISLHAEVAEGSAETVEDYDVELGSATIPAYATAGELEVTFVDDHFPEATEAIVIKILPADIASSGKTSNDLNEIAFNYEVTSANNPDALVGGIDWNSEEASDLDLVVYDTNGNEVRFIATAAHPESGDMVLNTDPDGTYYIGMDPYEFEAPQFEYFFGFFQPSGELIELSGTFDTTTPEAYTTDFSASLGTETYRLVQIQKSGTTYTVTQL